MLKGDALKPLVADFNVTGSRRNGRARLVLAQAFAK
jgi:hypothetical protein